MKRNKIILILTLLYASSTYSQNTCSDKDINRLKKSIKKENYCGRKGLIQFNLAQCYKSTNDSLCKVLLNESLMTFKGCYDHPLRSEITNRLFICSEIAFELKNYKDAEGYYIRALSAITSSTNIKPKYILIYGLTLCENKNFAEALKAFETYKFMVPSDKTVDEYIDKCKNK